jgi:uncharacterized cupredoxin-like copper-binding protein
MTLRLVPLLAALALVVAGAGAAGAQAAASQVHTVKVTAKDFKFILSSSTVPHGKITFVVKNDGGSAHDFAIAGHTSKEIEPGQSTTLVVTLKKGRYPYTCTVDSHAELGMKGVLHVK